MRVTKFPGNSNLSLYLNKHTTTIATGDIGQRVAMLDELGDEFADGGMVAFSLSGCLDAPERIPAGHTVCRPYFPLFNVHTEPATIARA
jgi:hypothetical protein